MSRYSILNSRDKRRKLILTVVFIVLMMVACIFLVAIFAASITLSISLVDLPISFDERGRIACFLDQVGSCTRCEFGTRRCPEWTTSDVTRVIQTQAKGSATLSAIFVLYGISALRYGFGLRKNVAMYQIDYV